MAVVTDDYVAVWISPPEVRWAARMARLACLSGGYSATFRRRRSSTEQWRNNVVGQLGELAGHKWWTGSVDSYCRSREERNANPREGDGGRDVGELDFKASRLLSGRLEDGLRYHLGVPPEKLDSDVVYTQILLAPERDDEYLRGVNAWITGWITGQELAMVPLKTEGMFRGTHCLQVEQLNPTTELA